MELNQENMDIAEKQVVKLFNDRDIQYAEASIICMNILAFCAIESRFPFEEFQRLINELASDMKKKWPIG